VRRVPRLCALTLLAWLHVAGVAFARDGTSHTAALTAAAQSTSDPAAALGAVDALAALEGREATQALIALLPSGLPDATLDRILEKLVEKPRPLALDVLEGMTRHRRAAARVLALRAVAALGATEPKLDASTSKLLAAALRDSDPRVRGTAASALGQRLERNERAKGGRVAPLDESIVELILRAVARGVPEAARTAGLATPEASLTRLYEALRGLPLTAVLDACDALLKRSTISEAAKLDVLARLGEIATPATKAYLSTLISAGRFPLNSPLQRALIETEKRIVPRLAPVPAPLGGAQ